MQALKDRHGDDIDFMAPDTVPTGPATDVFAPVDGGQAGESKGWAVYKLEMLFFQAKNAFIPFASQPTIYKQQKSFVKHRARKPSTC